METGKGAPQWRRTLTVAAVAQTLSILGFSFVTPFIPLYVQELGIHGVGAVTLWAAVLSGGSALGMVIAAPIWGVLADRYGRKIMVVRSMFSAAVLVVLMALVQNVYQLLALRLVQGLLTGTVGASQALVTSQTPRSRMGFSLGVMQTAVYVGSSLGPLGGGLVAQAVGFRHSFVVAAVALAGGGILTVLFIQEEGRFAKLRGAPRPQVLAGMKDVLRAPALLSMIAAIFAVQFGITVVAPILPQFVQLLQGRADHVAVVTGAIFTAAGVAGAVSSLTVGWLSDRIGYRTILLVAATAGIVISVPQYFVTATWQLFALRVGVGLTLGAVMPSASALLATLVPAARRGAAYGVSGSATSLGFASGPLTAAAVVAVIGVRAVFLTEAVLLLVIAVWVATMVHVPAGRPELVTGTEAQRSTA